MMAKRSEELMAEGKIADYADLIPKMIRRGYWVNNKYVRHPEIEKPCEKLDYCPYGQLVEVYPLNAWEKDARKAAKAEGMKFRDYMKAHPEINVRDCDLFGHECPAYYLAETTKDLS